MPRETIQRLRQQLREKFPAAHPAGGNTSVPSAIFGIPPQAPPLLHKAPPISTAHCSLSTEHFPSGAISELSPAHPACGLTLLLAALLTETPATETPTHRNPAPLVLIDARDRFDPASLLSGTCQRLLWLRCRETRQALQAADLLLRDGNLPFILLDLSALPARELRRIPTATWHRLRQLAQSTACTLLALTPTPLIPRAALRLRLTREFTLDHFDLSAAELLPQLKTETTHRHAHSA